MTLQAFVLLGLALFSLVLVAVLLHQLKPVGFVPIEVM